MCGSREPQRSMQLSKAGKVSLKRIDCCSPSESTRSVLTGHTNLEALTKIISGAVGGVAGGTLLSSLLGGAAGADPAAAGALGGLLTDALGGAGGGAILTGIVGAVMKAMNK